MRSIRGKWGWARDAAGLLLLSVMWILRPIPGVAAVADCSPTKGCAGDRFHNIPTKPFRIIANIYWVGLSDQSSFLLTTPQGHILVDTTSEETSPWVRGSIEELGFKMKDIKIITTTHTHGPHVGGFARFKELTGAKIIVPAGDAYLMKDGGKSDFDGGRETFRPITPDRVVGDGDKISLGTITMVAHLTPGHTKGCTTWTTTVEDSGQKYNVVIACPPAVGGDNVPLVNNAKYPAIAEDYAKAFSVMKNLPCDVFLTSRSEIFKKEAKYARMVAGEKPNPFIDRNEFRNFVTEYERLYLNKLAKDKINFGSKAP